MFLKIFTGIPLLFVTVFSYGESSGYKYVIDNYFSKRKSNIESYQGAPRHLKLYLGASVYGETETRKFDPLFSRALGFSQRIKEFPARGDLNLRVELQSLRLLSHRTELISIVPVFIFPDVRSGFPVYVGAGGGMSLLPLHLVRRQPALSLTGQIFAGLRLVDWYKNAGLSGEMSLKTHLPFYDRELYMEIFITLGFLFSF